MNNTPALDLELIKDRLNAATPGMWEWDTGAEPWQRYRLTSVCPPDEIITVGWDGEGNQSMTVSGVNVSFIAHARTDIALLVQEVERLRSEVAELRIEASRCTCYNNPD